MRYVFISGPELLYFRKGWPLLPSHLRRWETIWFKVNFFFCSVLYQWNETRLLRIKFSTEAEFEYLTEKFEFTLISLDPITRFLSLLYVWLPSDLYSANLKLWVVDNLGLDYHGCWWWVKIVLNFWAIQNTLYWGKQCVGFALGNTSVG